jgi:acetolactate synthase II small subunit
MHRFKLVVDRKEGALVRILGTLERRGFTAVSVHTEDGPQPATWTLLLAVEALPAPVDRSPAVLERQLRRLFDVRQVQHVVVDVRHETGDAVRC